MAFVNENNCPQPLWQPPPTAYPTASLLGGKKIALRGGKDTEAQPPPPSLAAVTVGGGFRAGVPDLPCRGGGGQPNIYGSK